MDVQLGLLLNAVLSGMLLGGFYAGVSVGVAIAFGMLDVVNIAHPAFIVLGAFVTFMLNDRFGVDPVLAGVMATPLFFAGGAALYEFYYRAFERHDNTALRGLAFFFGILFITEVALVLIFGVDYRTVSARYIGPSLHLGVIDLPLRMIVPCAAALAMVAVLQRFLTHSFTGRAIQAVSQDRVALQLMGVSPRRIKRLAFGLSVATAAVAGALLIIIQPVEPSIGRDYVGRTFAIVVMGGMGSFPGMVLVAMILGVMESLTATFFDPSWASAVAFGFLLPTLAIRSSGLLGRRV